MLNHKGITSHSRNQIYRVELRRGCSPPGTGGVDAPSRKCCEASIERRGRGGQFGETFRVSDHPVCAASERDRLLNGAATPPLRGGEHPRLMLLPCTLETVLRRAFLFPRSLHGLFGLFSYRFLGGFCGD